MTSQASVGKKLNKELKVFSNEKLMKIIRGMMYDESIIYLNIDVEIEDHDIVYVLHYNYNMIGYEIADCGERETRNISFSYYDIHIPDKQFYDTGSYFFDDSQLLRSDDDIYKKLLLKKFALLSFVYEYRHDIKLNEKSSDLISDQLKRVESHLFVKLHGNINEDLLGTAQDDFKEFLYDFLGKELIKSIEYKSYHTTWNYSSMKEEKIEPTLEPKSEAQINKELDSILRKYCLESEINKDIDTKLEALGLKLEEPEETDFCEPKKSLKSYVIIKPTPTPSLRLPLPFRP